MYEYRRVVDQTRMLTITASLQSPDWKSGAKADVRLGKIHLHVTLLVVATLGQSLRRLAPCRRRHRRGHWPCAFPSCPSNRIHARPKGPKEARESVPPRSVLSGFHRRNSPHNRRLSMREREYVSRKQLVHWVQI